MQQNRGGLWALGAFAVLTLVGLYVGAYRALVEPVAVSGPERTLEFEAHYRYLGSVGQYVFCPAHVIDRRWRRVYWGNARP